MGGGWLMELLEEPEGERGLEQASPAVHTPSPGDASSSPLAAEAAADAGMDEALRAERVARWKEQAEWWLEQQEPGFVFTADVLVADIGLPDLPDAGPARNNVVGAWINAQARHRRIEFSGELRKSRREAGHGNLQRVWRVRTSQEEAA
jgi:hypothetical protein